MKRLLTVPGNPVSKGRPRCGHRGVYTPEKTLLAEDVVRTLWWEKYGSEPWTTPVRVFLTFLEGPGQRAQDIDNLAKLVLDALNGLAWEDDKQVMALHAELFRSRAEGQSRILVEEMDG
jgi:Holliday junction resolvase RusA-like endonuclease